MNKMNSIIDNSTTKQLWNEWSDNWYKNINDHSILEKIIENPSCAFPFKVYKMITEHLGSLKGKSICVPSSGDNIAVFAFHLLGAKVTSYDISENQLNNARAVANKRGWNIEFICQDSMLLDKVESNRFDLLYTSNGVHVWISDLELMYKNFYRVLNNRGYFIFFDSHPITRPFYEINGKLAIKKKYSDIHLFEETEKYHWRIQDFINGLAVNNFSILKMEEIYSQRGDLFTHNYIYDTEQEEINDQYQRYDWKVNEWAALPQCISICAKK